jgi:hypothetical protein
VLLPLCSFRQLPLAFRWCLDHYLSLKKETAICNFNAYPSRRDLTALGETLLFRDTK